MRRATLASGLAVAALLSACHTFAQGETESGWDVTSVCGTGPGSEHRQVEHGTEVVAHFWGYAYPQVKSVEHLGSGPADDVEVTAQPDRIVIRSLHRDGPARVERYRVTMTSRELNCEFEVRHDEVPTPTSTSEAGTGLEIPTISVPGVAGASGPIGASGASGATGASGPAAAQPAPQPQTQPQNPPPAAPPAAAPAAPAPAQPAAPAPAAPAPAAPPPVNVTANYGSYAITGTLTQGNCYSPFAATMTVQGNADGSGLTLTFRPDHPPDANVQTYRGTLSADGSFTATASGSLESGYPSTFQGTLSGTLSGGRITATERISHSACGSPVIEIFSMTGSK